MTRSDMCETSLRIPRISTQIDKRKSNFLCTLIQTPPDMQPKQVFLRRLHIIFTSGHTNVQTGYIPDIITILNKYNLFYYICTWKYTSNILNFRRKSNEKRIVNDAIARQENDELQER